MLDNFDGQRDGTNAFIFSRYLVPYLCHFSGWAIFVDGDMVVDADIMELWSERESRWYNQALAVIKHNYKTKHPKKYVGSNLESGNVDYPRKNWSSVILWNCSHYANRALTPAYIQTQTPQHLHRFGWLKDEQVGELPIGWNHLVREYPPSSANLHHFTLGVPGIKHYADDYASWKWHSALVKALQCAGESPTDMVKRAEERVGAV